MSKTLQSEAISVEINDTTYRGHFSVSGKVITVTTAMGSKSTQLGSLTASHLASTLLRELVREGLA